MSDVSSVVSDVLSSFSDPRHEERTDTERPAWEAYVKAVNAAFQEYENAEREARDYYVKNRRGYLKGSIFQPSWKAALYPFPTDAMVEEFEKSESGHLKDYENAVFIAARSYFRAETIARSEYHDAVRNVVQSE